ncbi:T9SS type A sorting domain-containing protein [Flavobacterium franklandianum]|uniref:LamG-like jellyroll fold domain-containing protein n=1 Tax=Flavobacterium franklandianum TaxID=2594430 RepID=UPI00117A5D41|nr:LamG-like jellyroll fold domain-containing protein [Flavobacterium franklandianum]TRX27548.1 T9SS type A sorting domain-containing protein [Flavobacterium franklandianum]
MKKNTLIAKACLTLVFLLISLLCVAQKNKYENYKKSKQKISTYYSMFYLLVIISFLFITNTNAQTVLISPTGDGGFETGTTFASNGWIDVNGSNTSRVWYVGTGQSGFTGNRCALIGNSATNVGTTSNARTVHIYKSITIPAGATNISLSFTYKQAVADYSSSTYYDYVSVYTDNNTPTDGNLPTGTLQFGPYPNSNVTTFTSQNTTLPNSLAGTTTNLIFTFRCDAANPKGYGAIDDVSLTYTPLVSSPPTITSLGTTSGCVGSSITINGTNLTGATAASVTIGGTAVSSITSNSGTVIVAVVGSGTTGTVSVTTVGGTATSGTSFTVNPLPTANAGGALTAICQGGTTAALGGTYAGAATSAIWSTTSGGTFANNGGTTPNTTTWTPLAGFSGTATLILTTSGGSCTAATASKTQVVNGTPAVSVGSALTAICQGETTVALGGSYTGSPTSAIWSTTSGGSFTNNTGTTPSTTTWTPPGGFTGTASLVLTSAGGSCGTAISSKNQVVNATPTVGAGNALTTICIGGTTVALGGSYGGSATSAIWSTTSGGTFTNNGGTTPNTTTWTPPAAFSGTATLILTATGGSCTAATSKTQLVSGPTASAGAALTTICQGATSVALGGSYGGSATSAIWTDGGVGGTFTNNLGTTPNTTTWTPPAIYTGTATLTLTTSGGSCGTTNTSKTQVVSSGSFATVGSAMTITGSLISTSLGGNTPSTGSGAWTKISGPSGTVTFSNSTSGTSTATVTTVGNYVFRWTVTSTCGSSFADITVTYVEATASRKYTLFYEDFDATNGSWTNSTTTNGSWLWTSSFPATVAEIGENSFWRLDNYDDYGNNSVIEIDSPVYNFTGYQNLLFNIDIRYDTETDRDGMRILYSINGGAFMQLGASGSGINWYNSTSVNALGSNGWSNNSATATLAFTPVGIGPNRFIRATTTLDDVTFKNQSNVRFRVQFKSESNNTDNGVAFDNVSLEGDAITALALSPIAPAKINQNLSLWFKGNAGISVPDGTSLTTWEDQAYDTTRADLVNKENVKALVTDAPTFRDNALRNINFNPVIDFNASNKDYMNGKGGLYSQDYFVVVYSDDVVQNTTGTTGRQIPLGAKSDERTFHEDPTGLGLGNTTARYSPAEVIAHNVGAYAPGSGAPAPGVDSYGRAFTSTTVTYNEPLIINVKTNASGTQTEIYKNGIKVDNTTGRTGDTGTGNELNFYEYNNLPFYLGTGRSGISGRAYSALNGRLSEIVAYTAPNSALNQQKIQSYLGLKYGITLHDIASTNNSGVSLSTRLNDVNYIDSAANIIWNTTINTGYNYDITGIGRDDDSQLNQKQSKTVNTLDDITIGLSDIAATNKLNTNTFDTDKKFLVWGNNQGTLAAQPEVKVNMSAGITPALISEVTFISVGRTWKVVETGGNVPTAKVSIPTPMLSATLTPPGDYLMFISSTPNFDPTAEYRIMRANGANLETDYDFDGIKYITFGFAPEKTFVRSISFDGINDYLDAGKVLDLNNSFTVSAWIKRNSTNQTILSKRDNAFTTGYDLSINSAGKTEMSWMNGTKQTITSSVVIPSGIWHNVAVTFNGTQAKLYIDGVLDVTKAMSTVPANTKSFLIAAADSVTPTSFFNGGIDEVRVWKVALTEKQLRYVMNQEISRDATLTGGTIIPNTITLNDIKIIPWANLSAYYPMSTYTFTNAKDISNNNYTAALKNLTTVDSQTAPLPYESNSNGAWQTAATWLNHTVQDLPNSVSLIEGTIDWNIVKTSHNVSSTGNKTVLGLMVNSNTITASNDTKIEVTNYLKLDGKIDLVGMSQLVQTLDCDLDVTSSGSIERDQQGQANKYNYNYWSSPVSPINNTANNTTYTVAGMMKDGFNATPRNISWIGGYDGIAGNATTAMSIARYWLYTFDNKANDYANWNKILETTPIRVGLGFTMKGSGTVGTNYTFVGKPNNGLINSNSVLPDQLLLTGNPYPSALDADAFINDNVGSLDATDGTLYFWEHYSTNTTHVLKEYQGGYGVKNLVGGVAPVSAAVEFISQSGTSIKGIPKRYIPVGQGFFVNGKLGSGGTIIFNNNQRAFFKEDDVVNSNSIYKTRPKTSKTTEIDHWNNNSNDTIKKDIYKKVRLGFNSNNNYHRQVLLGFMNEKATSGMDYGYDGISLDEFSNDMYFLNGDKQLVIQGEGSFKEDSSYPLGVKTDVEGKVTFTIDALENFDGQQKVYIYDDETKTYNEIQKNAFEVTLPAGVYDTRFSLRFKDKSSNTDKTLSVEENKSNTNEIKIAHIQDSNTIVIKNSIADVSVLKVTLFNINGQSIANWKIENQDQQNIQIPINTISRGVYIVKLKTSTGELSKKLIVK